MLQPKSLIAETELVPSAMTVRSERIDQAERWLRDGLDVSRPPASFLTVEVDMGRCQALLADITRTGIKATYTHAVVRATALALAAHPDLHNIVCGGRRYFPSQIDIGLSVAGEAIVSPILVLEEADRKTLPDLASEIARRASEARRSDRELLGLLRRWGWILPFGFLRRAMIRLLMSDQSFRCKGSGTFQVTCLPGIDVVLPANFSTAAIVAAGAVRERVVVREGKILVRPTLFLTCAADHRVWDGRAAERFLATLKRILESASL